VCAVDDGFSCFGQGAGSCTALCGNGILSGAEQCDDANTNNGDGCSSVCQVENGFVCSGQGAGSCATIKKLFVTNQTFTSTQTPGGFGDIDAACKAQRGATAFFCNRADISARTLANQADPSVFNVKAWIRDPVPNGSRPGTCLNLTYNSGHLDDAQRIIVTANGVAPSQEIAADCGGVSFRGHCCLP
jgi:cysteine-rich repeat protein